MGGVGGVGVEGSDGFASCCKVVTVWMFGGSHGPGVDDNDILSDKADKLVTTNTVEVFKVEDGVVHVQLLGTVVSARNFNSFGSPSNDILVLEISTPTTTPSVFTAEGTGMAFLLTFVGCSNVTLPPSNTDKIFPLSFSQQVGSLSQQNVPSSHWVTSGSYCGIAAVFVPGPPLNIKSAVPSYFPNSLENCYSL